MLRGRAVPLVKGQVIADRYRLTGLIGRGGMGEVWSAVHLVTERGVAMKFVETSLRLTDRLRERLFREARAAGRVKHPGVIEVVDAFTTEDDIPVLVMELLEGEPLSRRLRREGALGAAEATDILLQVVSAVGATHERGIVHRDLKPDNVFLCRGEDGLRVKVLDFGVAKLAAPGEHSSDGLTSVGQVLGTPAYMAPEQCRGERGIDHRADMWAIGVMIYELMSGERPIEGESVGEVVEWLLTEGVPPLRELVPDAPFDVAVMARRLLERDPDARPQDLREVAEVLRRHCDRRVPEFGAAGSRVPTEEDLEAPSGGPDEGLDLDRSLAPAHKTVRERAGGRALVLTVAILGLGGAALWASVLGGETSRRPAQVASSIAPAASRLERVQVSASATGAALAPAGTTSQPAPSTSLVSASASASVTSTRPAKRPTAAPLATPPTPKTSAPPTPQVSAPPEPKGPKVQDWD